LQSILVGVFEDNEIYRRGLLSCLDEDQLISVVPANGNGDVPSSIQVAVVSDELARTARLGVPMIVCHGPNTSGLREIDDVYSLLPRRSLTPDQLVSAVRAAASRLKTFPPEAPAAISVRSRDVLRLMAEGASTREMAEQLGYSQRTIKAAIADALAAMGAHSRAHAAAEAVRRELV
jgi:DNA-binding CsgD family transcriptional regulator